MGTVAGTALPQGLVGSVTGLYIAAASGAPMAGLERAEVVAGRGIRGDRYFPKFRPN